MLHYYDSVDEYKEKIAGRKIFIAADKDQVHGFVDVHHPTPLLSHKKQWMIGIGVHPNSQSLGIGRQLLDYLKEVAIQEDIHKISLRVMGTNTKAIQFYEKMDSSKKHCLKMNSLSMVHSVMIINLLILQTDPYLF